MRKPFLSAYNHIGRICVDAGETLHATGMLNHKPFDGLVVVRYIDSTGLVICYHDHDTDKDKIANLGPINIANRFDHTRGRDTCLMFEFTSEIKKEENKNE